MYTALAIIGFVLGIVFWILFTAWAFHEMFGDGKK
jgi:hypothetical protein